MAGGEGEEREQGGWIYLMIMCLLVTALETPAPEALWANQNHKQTKNGRRDRGWKWTGRRGAGSFEDETRWSIDHPLTNTIEILDVMWEAPIHNLSVSQMWVTWSVDRGEHWVLISWGKKCTAQGGLKREEKREEGQGCEWEMAERGSEVGRSGRGGVDRGGVDGAQESH